MIVPLRPDFFHPRMKDLYGKYCPTYVRIPPSLDGMKNIPASGQSNIYKEMTVVF